MGWIICFLFKLHMKGAFNSRTRGNNAGLSRGGKTGTGSDWTVIQNGLTHLTHNGIFFDCGTSWNFWYMLLVFWCGLLLLDCLMLSNMCNLMSEQAKATDKGEGGSVCPSVMSVARKSTKRWFFFIQSESGCLCEFKLLLLIMWLDDEAMHVLFFTTNFRSIQIGVLETVFKWLPRHYSYVPYYFQCWSSDIQNE